MKSEKKAQVVFQLSNNDTFVQKSLIRQLNSLVEAVDDIRVEVVAHGYGIDLLLENSPFQKELEVLSRNGVRFLACENTLQCEKLERSQLLNMSSVVPAGIAHIIGRQGEGWSYIKAGY